MSSPALRFFNKFKKEIEAVEDPSFPLDVKLDLD